MCRAVLFARFEVMPGWERSVSCLCSLNLARWISLIATIGRPTVFESGIVAAMFSFAFESKQP